MVDEAILEKWFDKIDKDGSGSIDCEEFLSIFNGLNQKNAMNLDQLLLETFKLVMIDVAVYLVSSSFMLSYPMSSSSTHTSKLFSMMLMDREISIRLN